MQIHLPQDVETFVQQKVASGEFDSMSEVVLHGLYLLQEQDQLRQIRLDNLRKEIQKGVDSLNRGEVVVFDDALVERIKREGRKRLDAERSRKESA